MSDSTNFGGNTNAIKKRFIAGAVCPRCANMDTIVVFSRDGIDVRQCVNCDFEETKSFINNTRELQTRVNQANDSSQKNGKEEIQPIKLINGATNDNK